MQAVSVGPFLLSVAVLALVLGVFAAQGTAGFMKRRGYADVDAPLWWLLLAALGVARLGYVLRLWSSYSVHPLDIVDVRDGGFDLVAGLVVLALGVVLLVWRKKRWRLSLPVSVLVGVAAWALVLGAAAKLQEAAHPPMPSLVLNDLQGQPVQLDSLKGKPMVINLWATWCGPCRREMPVLVAAQQARADVRFIFADQGESAVQVRSYLQQNQLSPQHVLVDANSQLSQHYRSPGYPTTLFLDADGQLRDMHIGELSHATLADRLCRLTPVPDSEGDTR